MTREWSAVLPTAIRCGLSSSTSSASRPLFLLPSHARRRSLSPSPPPPVPPPPPNAAPRFVSSASCVHEDRGLSAVSCTRRTTLVLLTGSSLSLCAFPGLLISPSLAAAPPLSTAKAEEAGKEEPLERYTDKEEGFTLLKPSSWLKVDKAGATVLFVGESNNIGVVVSPVRLSSLKDFGTPQFVADKLIQAERRKESTKDAQMVSIAERAGHGGLAVYEFEYTVDSSRGGLKRIFSAAFVDAKKLYLLNIAHSDSSESPLDSKTRTVLEEVLHSFDAV